MKKLLVTLAAVLVSVSSWAQGNFGTISFHNRNLSSPTPGGPVYHAPITGALDPASARAQLYLVTSTGEVPLTPIQTFRTQDPTTFFNSVQTVTVTGQAPGTTGLTFLVKAWEGAATFETATRRGVSELITVAAGLGGTTAGGVIFLPPDLGGANGLQPFEIVPEPSTIAFGLLGAAALLYRRRK